MIKGKFYFFGFFVFYGEYDIFIIIEKMLKIFKGEFLILWGNVNNIIMKNCVWVCECEWENLGKLGRRVI